jgi:hypothetical protein
MFQEDAMFRIRGWTSLRASVAAFGLVAAAAGAAQAAPISTAPMMMTYDTTVGSFIGPSGQTSVTDPITYVPVSGASFLAPSSLSLGAFQVNALPSGQSVTYNNTPFSIKFAPTHVGDMVPTADQVPFNITGHLTGTVSGPNQSSVVATFDAPPTTTTSDPTNPGYQFNAGLYANTLKVADNPLSLVPSTSNNGMTTIQANLVSSTYTAPVPEPSTILLFAATAAGLGLRRQIRRARLAD